MKGKYVEFDSSNTNCDKFIINLDNHPISIAIYPHIPEMGENAIKLTFSSKTPKDYIASKCSVFIKHVGIDNFIRDISYLTTQYKYGIKGSHNRVTYDISSSISDRGNDDIIEVIGNSLPINSHISSEMTIELQRDDSMGIIIIRIHPFTEIVYRRENDVILKEFQILLDALCEAKIMLLTHYQNY